jgi:hypothetical protein
MLVSEAGLGAGILGGNTLISKVRVRVKRRFKQLMVHTLSQDIIKEKGMQKL